MIAARMLGRITFHSRCHQVAPSTLAASIMSSDTCARPASSSRDMNGVVFQISETMIANIAGSGLAEPVEVGVEERQPAVDEAVVELNANCQAKPETTVMMP